MKKCSVILCLAALALFVGQAGAVVCFWDNYEDDTIGSTPVISGTNIGAGYLSKLNIVEAAANPDSSSGSGNESAKVLQECGNAVQASMIFGTFDNLKKIDGMTISFDFYNPSTGTTTSDGVRVSLINNTAGQFKDSWIELYRDGTIKFDTGAGNTQTEVNYGSDVWQNFTGEFTETATAGTYNMAWKVTNLKTSASVSNSRDILIDVATYFTDGMFAGIALRGIEGNAGNQDFRCYYDNVSVTIIPEPATLLLLGIGGLLTLSRRKR